MYFSSSPHKWGTRRVQTIQELRHRFIPTHVGNSSITRPSSSKPSVHPHIHGELEYGYDHLANADGSSPYIWGTRPSQETAVADDRLIPTHVGNSGAIMAMSMRRTVHPHIHGELINGCTRLKRGDGSSPHMWGTRHGPWSSCTREPVHPHTCGELAHAAHAVHPRLGSSPHMWGTHEGARVGVESGRFIPTHVGNSWPVRKCRTSEPIHPHTCGELTEFKSGRRNGDGSSPHMWGTRLVVELPGSSLRFIPTHVGNSETVLADIHVQPVHPHTCGELEFYRRLHPSRAGSSPHMWGTLLHSEALLRATRFIPTHVGNS